MTDTPSVKTKKPDYGTLGGLGLAITAITGALLLEKAALHDMAQLTAFLIVAGGTLSAVMTSIPLTQLGHAAKRVGGLFVAEENRPAILLERLIALSRVARSAGLMGIEDEAGRVEEPFLRKALLLLADGVNAPEIRRHLEMEIQLEEELTETDARVFELAGGYAPTLGILGAVIGLIQVMRHLENTEDVGRGIATAFVATVYGVGAANLLLFPAGFKIRSKARQERQRRELITEGVLAIAEGMHPRLIRSKLENFAQAAAPPTAPPSGKALAVRETLGSRP